MTSFSSIFQVLAREEADKILAKLESPTVVTSLPESEALVRRAFAGLNIVSLSKIGESSGKSLAFICLEEDVERSLVEMGRIEISFCSKIVVVFPRLYGKVEGVVDIPVSLIPLEEYLFIVPSPNTFRRYFIEGDERDLYTIARSLLTLELLTGSPSRVFVQGEGSATVYELLEQLKRRVGLSAFDRLPMFDEVFIIDRTSDLASAFMVQKTYGGYLEEICDNDIEYGLYHGDVLSDSDQVYETLRHVSIPTAMTEVVKFMDKKAEWLQRAADHEANLPEGLELNRWNALYDKHRGFIERIQNRSKLEAELYELQSSFLEGNGNMKDWCNLSLRFIDLGYTSRGLGMLCWANQIEGSIEKKLWESVKQRVFSKYGPLCINGLNAFEDKKFIETSIVKFLSSNTWFSRAKEMGIVDLSTTDEDKRNLDSYTPYIVKVVDKVVKSNWSEDTERSLKELGHKFSIYRKARSFSSGCKRAFVFVIGGVNQVEVSGLRGLDFEVSIGSTNIITGPKLVRQICPGLK